ncbi:hypothetical protein Tco_0188833 [Tanacetum coccineum]
MPTYLKHIGGYTYKQLKGKSFDEIQKLFDKEIKRVNTFVDMGSEEEGKESDEVEEVKEDDEAELKKHLMIKKDEDIAIDAIPLTTKPPVIIDYKHHKEGMMDIDREDLLTLWKLVKTKHGDIRPEDEHERVMWGDFKVMFEPDITNVISTAQAYSKAAKSAAGEKITIVGLQLLEDFLLSRG